MEAVIFIGLQGAGKSTFYQQRFASTHVRINLDTLKTRHREILLLQECLREKRDFVVDNTNPTLEERRRYIAPAREAGFKVIGYYFDVPVQDCIERNKTREGKSRIPIPALYGTRKKLQMPARKEGFDELFTVAIASGNFSIHSLD
jgi:predicted kinase